MTLRTKDAADNKQIIPAGIILPDFDQRRYIIPAKVNDAPKKLNKSMFFTYYFLILLKTKVSITNQVEILALVVIESLNAHHNL